MKIPSSAEFAQFRFVRETNGNVVTLPCVGSDEKILLVLDCVRWSLARLHIFEEAAARADKREAFEEEMRTLADERAGAVSRLYSWGRDGEELFYADAMRDGEPLPEYLGRVGKVPVGIAARWMLEFIDLFGKRENLPASMDRCSTLNFEVVRGRGGETRLVFSEFTGWSRPGARVREHRWEWNLVQILCSLVGGVPVRTFYRDSLPRNFEELPIRLREVILATLSEDSRNMLAILREALQAAAEEEAEAVAPSPRMPMREWLRRELAESFPGEADRALPEFLGPGDEPYAITTRIRGSATLLQLLPGVDSLPREGWLSQHHDSTRRPGRGLMHQLQIGLLEDAGAVTLVGEEQVEGVDLASLLEEVGPVDLETARVFSRRIGEAIDLLERKPGACAVWWLPPANVLLLTGTRSLAGSAGWFERNGRSAWEEIPLKFRLHQTIPTLFEGIDLPERVRELARLPGKPFEDVRRTVVAMPLLWKILTNEPFSWRTRAENPAISPPLVGVFEAFRRQLQENPEEIEESFFEPFSQERVGEENAAGRIEEDDEGGETKGMVEEVSLRLEEALFQGDFGLATVPVVGSSAAAPDATASESEGSGRGGEAGPGIDDLPDDLRKRGPLAFWLWTIVSAVVVAAIVGLGLYGWVLRQGPYEASEPLRLTLPEFRPVAERMESRAREELSAYLLAENSPQSLRLLPLLENRKAETLHREIEPWLRHLGTKGDPAAFRIMGLLTQAQGEATDTVAGWFLEAARKGDREARYRYSALLWDPVKRRFSDPEAEAFLRASADTGHPGAKELLAHFLSAQGDAKGAFAAMTESAGAAWLPAVYQSGIMTAAGIGCPPDPEKGATLLRKAAETGEIRAMYDFARCLDQGFGVPSSHPEAIRWMRLAAGRGHGAALRWLLDRRISPSQE